MSYKSIDQLQKALASDVFDYAKDSKKAAGRALGTIVEIITFYLLKSWGFNKFISIERSLKEYGNDEISHNVEYSLHPVFNEYTIKLPKDDKSITATKIINKLDVENLNRQNNNLLSKDYILRNACTIARNENSNFVSSILKETVNNFEICICEQNTMPFAMFECKRVGVEEGCKKGPQTIEKAKQGAYVAKSISALQKIRSNNGDLFGVIYKNNKLYSKPYHELIEEIIKSNDAELLEKFILTVGVVSNHGNWFTAENHNKEMKVLAQSYDWLIFLTDDGIVQFIEELIISPKPAYQAVRKAFTSSYLPDKKKNCFTKVQMQYEADKALRKYFNRNKKRIEKWFNIISPFESNIHKLINEITILSNKNWENIR